MSLRLRVQTIAAVWAVGSVCHAASPKTEAKKIAAKVPAVRVVTAMSTPLRNGHPVSFLLSDEPDGERLATRLQFPADQRYSKWSVIFDSPLKIETVEVHTCEGAKPFADGVELFVDYNDKRLFSDGGRKVVKFNVKSSARALTLGFLESQGLCLERIRLKTNGEWIRPRTITAIGHPIVADGMLGVSPRSIPDGKKTKFLAVAKSERKPGEWLLSWDNPLIVENIRVWNGNQFPGEAFFEMDRVHDLEIRADGAKPIRASLSDRRYMQTIDLAEVRAVRTLEFKAVSSYPGTLATEPMISEIQLSAGGETWIPVIPATAGESIFGESLQADVVRERGYGDVLDRELRADDRGQTWKFRFRSDGTFFARIFVDRARVSKAWSVTGTWRLLDKITKSDDSDAPTPSRVLMQALSKNASPPPPTENASDPGLGVVLTGVKVASADALDSLPCANLCFTRYDDRGPNSVPLELPVAENIELQRRGRSMFFIRNRTEQEKQTMEFRDLKVRIHSLYD